MYLLGWHLVQQSGDPQGLRCTSNKIVHHPDSQYKSNKNVKTTTNGANCTLNQVYTGRQLK